MIQVGDVVICIKEIKIPQFVGKSWKVIEIIGSLYLCEHIEFYTVSDGYPFRDDEIVPASSLIKELL
jgi:hypothetical protein